jgi:hypothetical protein
VTSLFSFVRDDWLRDRSVKGNCDDAADGDQSEGDQHGVGEPEGGSGGATGIGFELNEFGIRSLGVWIVIRHGAGGLSVEEARRDGVADQQNADHNDAGGDEIAEFQ